MAGAKPTTVFLNKTYLTFAEAARRSEVSPVTMRRWVEAERLKTYQVKRRQMIAEEDLIAFLTPKPLEPGVMIPGLKKVVDGADAKS